MQEVIRRPQQWERRKQTDEAWAAGRGLFRS